MIIIKGNHFSMLGIYSQRDNQSRTNKMGKHFYSRNFAEGVRYEYRALIEGGDTTNPRRFNFRGVF
jgi:hypothetical protein